MSEYQVIARKYRPQQFKDVTGQEHVTTTLINAIKSGRIAHAYLFSGTKGIGKTTTARIMAKALNCQNSNKPTITPCDKCPSCQEIIRGMSLDVLEIDGASNRGIDEIRQLRENVKLAPAGNRYKIYIIDEVHMLTTEAFNALLKTLEEPPSHVKFFFATTAPEKLPATILSRCQRFNLHMLSNQLIIDRLRNIADQEKIEIEEDSLYTISRYANGSMRDAESTLEKLISFSGKKIKHDDVLSILGIVAIDILFNISDSVTNSDIARSITIITQVFQEGKDLVQFVLDLTTHFRNILIAKQPTDIHKLINLAPDDIAKILNQSKNYSQTQLLDVINILTRLQGEIKWSLSKQIALEVAIINITRSKHKISLDLLIERLEGLEQKLSTTPNNHNTTETIAPNNPTPQKAPQTTILKPAAPVPPPQEPTKPHNPKPTPQHPEPHTLEHIKTLWKEIIANIGKRHPVLKSYLAEGKLISMKNDTLTIGFDKELSLHQESLTRKHNKETIEKLIEQRIQHPIRTNFVFIGEEIHKKAAKAAAADKRLLENPLIEKAQKMFGAKIVSIKQK